MPGSPPFHEALVALRRRADLTQEALAQRSGVGIRTIGALERGERAAPHRETVRRLAVALGVRPSALYGPAGAAGPGGGARRGEATDGGDPGGGATGGGGRAGGAAGGGGRAGGAAGGGGPPGPERPGQDGSALGAHAAEMLGLALHRAGRYDAALAELEVARRRFRQRADADGCARLHAAIGQVHVQRGRCDLALVEVGGAPAGDLVSARSRAQLALVAARARELQGDVAPALAAATAAVALAGQVGDPALLAGAHVRHASVCTQAGDLDAAEAGFVRATELAPAAADDLQFVRAQIGLVIVLLRRGPMGRARLQAERALAGAERIGDVASALGATVHAAAVAREQDDRRAATRLARSGGVPTLGEESVQHHHCRILLALLALDCGAPARSRALLEPLTDPVRSSTNEETRREATVLLAGADLADGRAAAAAGRLTGLRGSTGPPRVTVPDAAVLAARALCAIGRPEEAHDVAERFLAAADRAGSVLHTIEALRARAAARSGAGRAEDAQRDRRVALELATAGGFALRQRLLEADAALDRTPPGPARRPVTH